MTSKEALEKLYEEREYAYADKVNNKGITWSNDISHYDTIGKSLSAIKEDLDVLYLLDELGIIDELIIDTLNCGNHYKVSDDEWKILYRWYENHRGKIE